MPSTRTLALEKQKHADLIEVLKEIAGHLKRVANALETTNLKQEKKAEAA